MNEKARDIMKKIGSVFALAIIVFRYFVCLASGFKWPSDYILTNHIISYRQGFLPRSFIGAIGYLIFGDKWYSWKYITPVVLFFTAVFLIWILVLIVKSGFGFKEPVIFGILAMFAISPFARYYIYDTGYYEQYGYVMLIVLMYLHKKNNKWSRYIVPAILSFIAVLISESNLFLVVPVMFAFSYIVIVADEKNITDTMKKLGILVATYVPTLAYAFLVFFIKIPAERIAAIQNYDREMVNNHFPYFNFNFREDVHLYMSGDRSNTGGWSHTLHPIHMWCVIMTLILVVFVTYVLIENGKSKRMIFAYVSSAVIVGIAAYSIVIVAWDLERYAFNMFISVLMVSLFTLKRYEITKFKKKESWVVLLLFFIASIGFSNERLEMFNLDTYNYGLKGFLDVLRMRLNI